MPNTKLSVLLVLFIALSLSRPLVFATDATSSGADINEVTTNLRERLKDALGSDSEPEDTRRAHVGVVRDIIKNTVVLEDKDGRQSVVVGDDATVLRTPGSATIKLGQIQIDDNIIAIGYQSSEEELLGKRLIVSSKPFSPPAKLSGLGEITSVGKYAYTVKTEGEPKLELFFTSDTLYKSPLQELSHQDVHVGDSVLFTAVRDKDGDWSATVILQIKTSSPSPTESPSGI